MKWTSSWSIDSEWSYEATTRRSPRWSLDWRYSATPGQAGMGAREAAAAAGYRATLALNAAAQVGRPRRCSRFHARLYIYFAKYHRRVGL